MSRRARTTRVGPDAVARRTATGAGPLAGAALGALLGLLLSAGGTVEMLVGLVAGYVLGEWLDGVTAGALRARRAGARRVLDVVVAVLALAVGSAALSGYGRPARWLGLVGGLVLLLVGLRLLLRSTR